MSQFNFFLLALLGVLIVSGCAEPSVNITRPINDLNDLRDVNYNNPDVNNVLLWDGSQWINGDANGTGGTQNITVNGAFYEAGASLTREPDTNKFNVNDANLPFVRSTVFNASFPIPDSNTLGVDHLAEGSNITISCTGSDLNGTCTINSTASGFTEADANSLYVKLNPSSDQNILQKQLFLNDALIINSDSNLTFQSVVNPTLNARSLTKVSYYSNSFSNPNGQAASFDVNSNSFGGAGALLGGYRSSGFLGGNADYFGGYFWNNINGNMQIWIGDYALNSNQGAGIVVRTDSPYYPQLKLQYDVSNGFNTQINSDSTVVQTIDSSSGTYDYSIRPNVYGTDFNFNIGNTGSGHYDTKFILNNAWAGTPSTYVIERTSGGGWTTTVGGGGANWTILANNFGISSSGNLNMNGTGTSTFAGSVDVAGHLGVGNAAAPVSYQVLSIDESPSSSVDLDGIYTRLALDHSGTVTKVYRSGYVTMKIQGSSAADYSQIISGMEFPLDISGASGAKIFNAETRGLKAFVSLSNNSNLIKFVGDSYGLETKWDKGGDFNVVATDIGGLKAQIPNIADGNNSITNAYGIKITHNTGGGGGITNKYGLYIDSVSGSSSTNQYGAWIGGGTNGALTVASGKTRLWGNVDVNGALHFDAYAIRDWNTSSGGSVIIAATAGNTCTTVCANHGLACTQSVTLVGVAGLCSVSAVDYTCWCN